MSDDPNCKSGISLCTTHKRVHVLLEFTELIPKRQWSPSSSALEVLTYSNHFRDGSYHCTHLIFYISIPSLQTDSNILQEMNLNQTHAYSVPSLSKGNNRVKAKNNQVPAGAHHLPALQAQDSHSTSFRFSFFICKIREINFITGFQILSHKVFRIWWRFQSMTVRGLHSKVGDRGLDPLLQAQLELTVLLGRKKKKSLDAKKIC